MTVTSPVAVDSHLRLDISVENTVAMHVVDRLEHLVHVILHSLLRQVVPPSLDGLVHVHVHELEDQGESPGRFIARQRKLNVKNDVSRI